MSEYKSRFHKSFETGISLMLLGAICGTIAVGIHDITAGLLVLAVCLALVGLIITIASDH